MTDVRTPAALEAQHDALCLRERDHHDIRHCRCDLAAQWLAAVTCPACKRILCTCSVCDGTGWTRDEVTLEPELCLVCSGQYHLHR